MAILNTRIVLRNDSTGGWQAAVEGDQSAILLKGEVGIEFNPNAENDNVITKFKIGDGVHSWEDLPYYEEKFENDFIFTSAFGKYTPDKTGSVTVAAKGKTMSELLTDAFSTEDLDFTVTLPSITLTAGSGQGYKAYEVGATATPSYSITFNKGAYPYGPDTGVTATNYEVSFNGETLNGASGTFTSFVVPDNFKQKVSAIATYSDATASPKSNLGNDVNNKKIVAGTTAKKEGSELTSYRSYFYGKTNKNIEDLTSSDIRSLTNGGNYSASKTIEIKANGDANVKYFVVAIPADNTRTGITKVESTAGMTVTVTDQWTKNGKTLEVADARGGENGLKNYKLSYWTAAEIDANTVHKVTLG